MKNEENESGNTARGQRLKALEVLIREGQRDNVTKAGRVRVQAACKALGLDAAETTAIGLILEFSAPPETGEQTQ